VSNKFEMVVGDWSGDGHNQSRAYIIHTSATVEDAREAHFKCPEVLGFDIGDIAKDYDESIIPGHIAEALIEIGLLTDAEKEEYEDEDSVYVGHKRVAEIWVAILNHIDPNLKLHIPSVEELPSLHFYGFDEKNRHLNTPGYGCFE
jgi:hypothetical protein